MSQTRDKSGRFSKNCQEGILVADGKGGTKETYCIMPKGHSQGNHLYSIADKKEKPTIAHFLAHCFAVGLGLGVFIALIVAGLHAPSIVAFNFGVVCFILGTPVYMVARHIIDHFKFNE